MLLAAGGGESRVGGCALGVAFVREAGGALADGSVGRKSANARREGRAWVRGGCL